jgi:hypothetical protein
VGPVDSPPPSRPGRPDSEGVWSRILMALASRRYSMGRLSLDRVSVDSTTVEAEKGGSF